MEIKKSTVVQVFDSNGNEMVEDLAYVFETSECSFCGIYKGISKRGALMFDGIIADTEVKMNVMPKSIVRIHMANIEIGIGE